MEARKLTPLLPDTIMSRIAAVCPANNPEVEDEVSWKLSPSGQFVYCEGSRATSG